MSNLLNLINNWTLEHEESEINAGLNFKKLFINVLHKQPYHLKYTLDKTRPDLFLIHTTPLSDQNDPVVQECNGIIMNKSRLEIVSWGLEKLIEKEPEFLSTLNGYPENFGINESDDGTMLKLFFYNDEWLLSTNKRIDASRVKWSSDKSFRDLAFSGNGASVLEILDKLEKDYTYVFILLSPDNHNVIKYDAVNLVYLGKRNMNDHVFYKPVETETLASLCILPNKISLQDACIALELNNNTSKRGLIIESNNYRYKIDYPWFKFSESLRKNLRGLRNSYLANNPQSRLLFKIYFPDFDTTSVEKELNDLAFNIFNIYRDIYIQKKYRLPKDDPAIPIINRIHQLYKSQLNDVALQNKQSIGIKQCDVDNIVQNTDYWIIEMLI
jgi:hypothetical protein